MYVVKLNGDKVKVCETFMAARIFVRNHCKSGKAEIVAMTESKLPVASRMHYNECFENYGAYRYNPFALTD